MSQKAPQGTFVALVPMRHHSVRVSGKNFRELAGVPLYHYVLRTLMACPSLSEIVVDTDSEAIREGLQRAFPQVRVIDRPASLRGDDVPMTEILFHDTSQVPADYYLQTHSTNPFLKPETIERAIQWWMDAREQFDSLFSVTRIQARLWSHTGHPVNHDPSVLLQTQALSPIYLENSCLYLFPAALIRSTRRRVGVRPKLFEIDPIEGIDIDEERDFAFAELLIRAQEMART